MHAVSTRCAAGSTLRKPQRALPTLVKPTSSSRRSHCARPTHRPKSRSSLKFQHCASRPHSSVGSTQVISKKSRKPPSSSALYMCVSTPAAHRGRRCSACMPGTHAGSPCTGSPHTCRHDACRGATCEGTQPCSSLCMSSTRGIWADGCWKVCAIGAGQRAHSSGSCRCGARWWPRRRGRGPRPPPECPR